MGFKGSALKNPAKGRGPFESRSSVRGTRFAELVIVYLVSARALIAQGGFFALTFYYIIFLGICQIAKIGKMWYNKGLGTRRGRCPHQS